MSKNYLTQDVCFRKIMGDSEGQEFFRPGPAEGDELITSEDLENLQDEFKNRKGKHTPENLEIGRGGNNLS